jgi:hypothetical protein
VDAHAAAGMMQTPKLQVIRQYPNLVGGPSFRIHRARPVSSRAKVDSLNSYPQEKERKG